MCVCVKGLGGAEIVRDWGGILDNHRKIQANAKVREEHFDVFFSR